jgi:hypothetical protein
VLFAVVARPAAHGRGARAKLTAAGSHAVARRVTFGTQTVGFLKLAILRPLKGAGLRFLAGFATRTYLDDLLGGEGAMYRALPGNLEELRALLIDQRPVEFDVQLDRIYPPLLGFALGAVIGVDLRVLKPGCDASERQTFPLGIHREGHRCARPQRRKQ